MSRAADELERARAARDAARVAYDASLKQLRGDPAEQSIGGRVAERLSEDARAAFDKALNLASESKVIIAGTVATLALWFLRHPIIAWAEHVLGDEDEESETDD